MRAATIILVFFMLSACSGENVDSQPGTTDNLSGSKVSPSNTEGSVNGYSAAVNYALNCQGCHLPNGEGIDGRVPAMQNMVSKFLHSAEGRRYLTRVPGVTNAALTDADLAGVMNYVVKTQDFGNLPQNFSPFTAPEMNAGRANGLGNKAEQMRASIIKRNGL